MLNRLKLWLLPFLVRISLLLLGSTLRIKETGNVECSPRHKKNGQYIYALWHSRILISLFYFRHKGIASLVSMGKDGEYIARVMQKLGFKNIRGSSSREGVRALIAMKNSVEEGSDAAITPDGPRGPKEQVQSGIIMLAKMTGVPIAPYGFDASRKKTFNSWDNTILPSPFSKGVFVWGELISVPKDADETVMEQKRKKLDEELVRLQVEASKLC